MKLDGSYHTSMCKSCNNCRLPICDEHSIIVHNILNMNYALYKKKTVILIKLNWINLINHLQFDFYAYYCGYQGTQFAYGMMAEVYANFNSIIKIK